MIRLPAVAVLLIVSSSLCPLNAHASWMLNGVVVSARPDVQQTSVAAPDGSGGAIITWIDGPIGAQDIYAQRIDAHGNALWAPNGIPICAATGNQWWPVIASDDAGGAIIAWEDDRDFGTTSTDIFAQRVNASGGVMWAPNGVTICNATGQQQRPRIDANLAFTVIAWHDRRISAGNTDIFAQRLDQNGAPLWAGNGVAVCLAANAQQDPDIVDDGAGGAIVTWHDPRTGDLDVYARAVNFLGTPVWTNNGVPVAVLPTSHQQFPRIISDGAFGAIIVWEDGRGATPSEIYAQRLNSAGTTQWTANGRAVCATTGNQTAPTIGSDGAGGAIIAWQDFRGASDDIYAQRLTTLGVPLWTFNGSSICLTNGSQSFPRLVPDGEGGAVIAWKDDRLGSNDVFAQRVDAGGLTYWTTNGVSAVSAALDQTMGSMIHDGNGGVIVPFDDLRSGDQNIYAQRIELRHGYWGRPEPTILAVLDNPDDQGGVVALDWLASERDALQYQEISHYSVWRAVDAVPLSSPEPDVTANALLVRLVELSDISSDFTGIAYRLERTPAANYLWEFVATQSAIYAPGYSFLCPTRYDATGGGSTATHYFQVVAHTNSPNIFFPSPPDSGESVDNLAPAIPQLLTAMRTTGTNVDLDWAPSGFMEADFKEYWVYRAETPGFPTDPSYFLLSTPDTLATDGTADLAKGYYYKVVAFDVHDNKSGDSNEAMVNPSPTGVGGEAPTITSVTLLPNVPNPFNGTTELRIGLPRASDATLDVYDVAGRRVASRSLPGLARGWQRVLFDGRSDAGDTLPSGVYFCRVTAAGGSTSRKIVVSR